MDQMDQTDETDQKKLTKFCLLYKYTGKLQGRKKFEIEELEKTEENLKKDEKRSKP